MTWNDATGKDNAQIREGGYHSQGVPGEEQDVRKQMRVLRIDDIQRTISQSQPIKGGAAAESTAQGRYDASPAATDANNTGVPRPMYVLARRDQSCIDTPVFHAGRAYQKEAVFVFSTEEQARKYLSAAGWDDTHEPAALIPTDLGAFVREAKQDNVSFVVVDPIHEWHMQGEPQKVLDLDASPDLSGENLYRELTKHTF